MTPTLTGQVAYYQPLGGVVLETEHQEEEKVPGVQLLINYLNPSRYIIFATSPGIRRRAKKDIGGVILPT